MLEPWGKWRGTLFWCFFFAPILCLLFVLTIRSADKTAFLVYLGLGTALISSFYCAFALAFRWAQGAAAIFIGLFLSIGFLFLYGTLGFAGCCLLIGQ